MITFEFDIVCDSAPYPIMADDCPAGSLFQWRVLYVPPGVNPTDVRFFNQYNTSTTVSFPPFEGKYIVGGVCREPV